MLRPLSIVSMIVAASLSGCRARSDDVRPNASGGADIALSRETTVVAARVGAGATLASILRGHGVAVADIGDAIARAASVFDLRKVRADQPYRLEAAITGALRWFEYEIDRDRYLKISRVDETTLVADVLPIPKTRRIDVVRGRIDRDAPSLASAMDAAGETVDLTLAVAEIFGGEIDFSTGVQPGDTFQIAVEKQFRDNNEFAGYGPVAAAEFINNGRRVRAVRFAPDGGSPAYYDDRGASMKRFFLASPLKFQPLITSGFSLRRVHPILQEVRAHLGVDYKAPAGAPVVAVADGLVVSAGMSGGSGNLVHLRHSNGFETEYLHLSAVAVRAGARVRQGELIGRVGMTGLATGPHLDYRVKKNGAFINPAAVHRSMPPAEPIPPADEAAFATTCDAAFGRFAVDATTRDQPVRISNALVK